MLLCEISVWPICRKPQPKTKKTPKHIKKSTFYRMEAIHVFGMNVALILVFIYLSPFLALINLQIVQSKSKTLVGVAKVHSDWGLESAQNKSI